MEEGEVWDVDEGNPRYVDNVAGRDDLTDGRHPMSEGDMFLIDIRSSGVFDFSQCIFSFLRVGGGHTSYLIVGSSDCDTNDALGGGNSAVSGGATEF